MEVQVTYCYVCGKEIFIASVDDGIFWKKGFTPLSFYWNNDRREIYCGPLCSLISEERS